MTQTSFHLSCLRFSDAEETAFERLVWIMEAGKETRMTPMQLEMLLEYLPDGVILEIAWESADEERT